MHLLQYCFIVPLQQQSTSLYPRFCFAFSFTIRDCIHKRLVPFCYHSKVFHILNFLFAFQFNCWETILHGSLAFSHILQAKALINFGLDYLFKDVCFTNSFRSEIASPFGEKKSKFLCNVIIILSSVMTKVRQTYRPF